MDINMREIQVIDTHTGGEPTRVVISGGPPLGNGPVSEKLAVFARQYDAFRSAVVNEPRGSDVMVGALLVEPADTTCFCGVIFFNNVGYLGMCGHGTMGVAAALGHLGRITAGQYCLETPVGIVRFAYDGKHAVRLENVPAYRYAKAVELNVPGVGKVVGDVAWGGNWFFLVDCPTEQYTLANLEKLTDISWRIRQALENAGVTGADHAVIDHVELFGPPQDPVNNSRNFVLCPGRAYDRSPCGTGTSAKLACLFADGKIQPGQVWRQESILGSLFEGSVASVDGRIIPVVSGSAFVNGRATLLLDAADPFMMGIRP